LIEYVDKILITLGFSACLHHHHGKIAAGDRSSAGLSRSEEVHGSQDEFPGLVHRAGHALQERLARRGGFRALVNWQIAEGTNGLVPVGTTGESPTVSHDEHKRVVEWCIDEAKGRVPGDRRRRLEFDQGGDRAGAACREGRAPTPCWW
jgi:hypothetical protein